MTRFTALALVLALAARVSAQVRIGAAAESGGVPAAAPVGVIQGGSASSRISSLTLPTASISLSVVPAPAPSPSAAEAAVLSHAPAAAIALSPAAVPAAAAAGVPESLFASKQSAETGAVPAAAPISLRPTTRAERATVLIQDEVASWGPFRRVQDVVVEGSRRYPALAPLSAAAAASEPDGRSVPVPSAKSPAPNGSPRLTRALVYGGFALVGVALVPSLAPALLPAAVAAYKGAIAWAGLAALTASRFVKPSEAAPDVPRGPPSDGKGMFGSFKGAWAAARDSADAQTSFEKRSGGFSLANFRDWALGALRTGTYWMGPSLLLMLGGALAGKAWLLLAGAAPAAVTGVTEASIAVIPFSAFLGGIVPMALAAQAAGLGLYFLVEKLAARLGAGRFAPWLGGAAALALAAATVAGLTASPVVIASTLALEAGVIWTAARSRSFAAPLALRAILTVFSLEAARLGAWIKFGPVVALAGLPPVWGGVIVLGLVTAAVLLKSPALRLAEIGREWLASEPGQRPKNPWPVLTAGLMMGLVVYAIGDLVYWAVNWLSPSHEPAPAILAKMLTGGVDLVLYNFVIVGVLEEFIFRRGLFKWMNDKFDKIKRFTQSQAFWIAAVGSAIIFSGVHYIDWGAVMAKFGLGDATTAAGMGGAYAFTWAGFVARSVLGVVLAWIYKRSGFLLIPIIAHFWADSMEGLGLRWGLPAFAALAAGAMLIALIRRPKAKAA